MIAWPGTAVAGNYVLTVIYEGKTATIDYVVYDAATIVEMTKNTMCQKQEMQIITETNIGNDFTIVNRNCEYDYDSSEGDGSTIRQGWTQLNGEEVYEYTYHIQNDVVTVKNKNICDADGHSVGIISYVTELLDYNSSWNVSLSKNSDGTYQLTYVQVYEDSTVKTVYQDKYTIKNGLVISSTVSEASVYTNESRDPYSWEVKYTYKYDNIPEIPEIPTNVEWDVTYYD